MEQMQELGQVVDIRDGKAHVKFTRSSACGRCQACGMLASQNEIVIEVPNELGASVGDMVAVSIRSKKALGASALAYVFPLIMLIVGVAVGLAAGLGVGRFRRTADAGGAVRARVCGSLFCTVKIRRSVV